MTEKNNHGVIKQASFLMAATLICRIIGLLYRSPLHTIMGDVGDGYYSLAYEWYNIILLISSYSIPMAVSKVMAELLATRQYQNAQKVFKAALFYVFIVGGAGSLFAFFGAPLFLSTQPGAVLALRVLAPTIFLSGILGVLRGYFQARNTMMPTAISQIAEQIINAVISVVAALAFTRAVAGDEVTVGKYGAAGGTLGTGAGVVTGIACMLFFYFYNRKTIRKSLLKDKTPSEMDKSYGEVFRMILMMVTPVILATCVYNVSSIVDQSIFTRLMPLKGFAEKEISVQYALFGYKFKPIINIPIALASATSTALIPAVASCMALKEKKAAGNKIVESINFTMFLAIPCAVGMAVLSLPVIRILYPGGNQQAAAWLLTIGSVSVVFYCLSTVTNGVLQGLGKPSLPVRNSAIALVINAVVLVISILVFNIGVYGILLATIAYAVSVSMMNSHCVRKYIPYQNDYRNAYGLPLISAGFMALVIGILYWLPAKLFSSLMSHYLMNALWTCLVIVAGILTYFAAYVKFSHKTEAELKKMPFGTRIVQLMHYLHVGIPK